MGRERRLSRNARWAVPIGAIAAVALVIAGSMLASAQAAAPVLPARTAATLLAEVGASARVPSAFTGQVTESASLGLPQLPDSIGGLPGYSLLAGSHSFSFWYGGPARLRIAVPVQLGETDLRQDGRQVWLWDSRKDTATHIVLPARPGPHQDLPGAAGQSGLAGMPLTPQQAARQLLAAVGPTTTVSVQRNVTVAGQAAYQLAIAPRAGGSLVGQIRIAIDARGYLPLRLQVFARGAAVPAYQIGYTSLSFARPAASNFAFAPPPGATVKTIRIPSGPGGLRACLPMSVSPYWKAAAVTGHKSVVPRGLVIGPMGPTWQQRRSLQISIHAAIRKGLPPRGTRGAMLVPGPGLPKGSITVPGWIGTAVVAGQVTATGSPPSGPAWPAAPPQVIGKHWLSVLVLHLDPASIAALGPAAAQPGPAAGPSSSASVAGIGSAGIGPAGPVGSDLAVLRLLLRAATPVHGAWGSGRLLRTSLLSVLFTSDGRVLLGAVTPAVLYSDAAKAK